MASRLLVTGRRRLLRHPDASHFLHSSFSIFGCGQLTEGRCVGGLCPVVADNPSGAAKGHGQKVVSVAKKELLGLSSFRLLKQSPGGISITGSGYARSDIAFPLGARYLLHPVRMASSAATAVQPVMGGEEEHNEKKTNEASPEECDQPVEGLVSAKAKAKAKQRRDLKRMLKVTSTVALG